MMGTIGKRAPGKSNMEIKGVSTFDKRAPLFLWGILSLALILRVLALLSLKKGIYFDFLLWDEQLYHTWAAKIAAGTETSTSVYEFAPLPAYVMALIYKLFSANILYIRIANILFGVATCLLIYLIGKELRDKKTGLFASLMACLYGPFILYSIVPLKTSMSLFLFALSLYFFVAVITKSAITKAILLGICVGLAINVRANYLILVPLILLIILWRTYKRKFSTRAAGTVLVLYMVGLMLAISPFIIRNYRVAGEFALTTTQTGRNLFYSNNLKNRDPYYRPVAFASSAPAEQAVQFTIEASRRSGKKLTPQDASRFWTREVLSEAMSAPGAFAWKMIQKTLVFLNRFEPGDHYHMGFLADFVRFFKFPFLCFWLVFPFGMAGMITNIKGSMKSSAFGLVFLFYALTLIAFSTYTRYRLPVLVILMPFAVMGINDLLAYIKTGKFKKAAVYAAIVLAFMIVEFLPVRGTGDLTAYYNTHAYILNQKGDRDGAMKYWDVSSRSNGAYSAYANLFLAGKYFEMGDASTANAYLDKIPRTSFAAAAKYALIGDVLVHQGKVNDAIAAYEKSLEINWGQRRIRRELVRLYWKTDPKKALEEYQVLNRINAFYDG